MQKVKTVSCSVRNGFTVSFYIHDSRKTKKVSFFYKFLNEIFFTKLSAFNFNSLLILKNKKNLTLTSKVFLKFSDTIYSACRADKYFSVFSYSSDSVPSLTITTAEGIFL